MSVTVIVSPGETEIVVTTSPTLLFSSNSTGLSKEQPVVREAYSAGTDGKTVQ